MVTSKNNITGTDLNIIGPGTIVEGKIQSQGSIRIDGKLIGKISVGGNLAIGTGGEIEGDAEAKAITVSGKLTGNIIASEKLVLENKAVVKGDIKATRLVVDEGATFDGNCTMNK
jgi:cytoskeletal protein CcmA (bactofilin family)